MVSSQFWSPSFPHCGIVEEPIPPLSCPYDCSLLNFLLAFCYDAVLLKPSERKDDKHLYCLTSLFLPSSQQVKKLVIHCTIGTCFCMLWSTSSSLVETGPAPNGRSESLEMFLFMFKQNECTDGYKFCKSGAMRMKCLKVQKGVWLASVSSDIHLLLNYQNWHSFSKLVMIEGKK